MIAEKIAQAKKDKQKKRVHLLVIIVGAALMAALLLILATNFKLNHDEKTAKSTSPEQPTASIEKPMPKAEQPTLADNVNDSPPPPTDNDRQGYIDAYQHYQTTIEPSLESIELTDWDKATADKLQQLEDAALEAFTAADYTAALHTINKLAALANDTLERSQKEFDANVATIKQAYSALDQNKALLALEQARLHQKDNPQLTSLANQIEKIPSINELEQTIAIAKTENKPAKELKAIQALAKIDPNWGNHRQRAATLTAQFANNKFKQAIERGYAALDQNQINGARAELSKAKAISPSRTEIQSLNKAITQLERTQRLATTLAAADKAQTSDDWSKVIVAIKQALSDKPDDQQLTRRLAKANQIIASKQQMATLLTNPYRLTNTSVKARANTALSQAAPHNASSPSLKALSIKLADTIDAVNKAVAVTIVSDGITAVSIRGVGIVGAVDSKVIQLKPGLYTFEGKRQGYKSKILKTTIPLGKASFKLTLVADERI